MTSNMKVIKTQSDPNSSDFPMGKTSSVTEPDSLKECLRFARATGGRTWTVARPQFTSCLLFEKD